MTFFSVEQLSRDDCMIADLQLMQTSLLIGDNVVSFLRGNDAPYLSIDDDILSLLMGYNTAYSLIGDNALSLSMNDNSSYFLLSPCDNASCVSS